MMILVSFDCLLEGFAKVMDCRIRMENCWEKSLDKIARHTWGRNKKNKTKYKKHKINQKTDSLL